MRFFRTALRLLLLPLLFSLLASSIASSVASTAEAALCAPEVFNGSEVSGEEAECVEEDDGSCHCCTFYRHGFLPCRRSGGCRTFCSEPFDLSSPPLGWSMPLLI